MGYFGILYFGILCFVFCVWSVVSSSSRVNTQVYNQVAQVYNQKKMRQKKNGTQGIQSQQNEKEKKEKKRGCLKKEEEMLLIFRWLFPFCIHLSTILIINQTFY